MLLKPLLKYNDAHIKNPLFIKNFLREWLCYNYIFIHNYNIDVEYNNLYDVFFVSVFRESALSLGTKEYRNELWNNQKQSIVELFSLKPCQIQRTWRWIEGHHCYTEPQDCRQIEGIRFNF